MSASPSVSGSSPSTRSEGGGEQPPAGLHTVIPSPDSSQHCQQLSVFFFGRRECGPAADGLRDVYPPIRVDPPFTHDNTEQTVSVACARRACAVVGESGSVFCWGRGVDGFHAPTHLAAADKTSRPACVFGGHSDLLSAVLKDGSVVLFEPAARQKRRQHAEEGPAHSHKAAAIASHHRKSDVLPLSKGSKVSQETTAEIFISSRHSSIRRSTFIGPQQKSAGNVRHLKLCAPVDSVAMGATHAVLLTAHHAFVMGSNQFGQLGLGRDVLEAATPAPLRSMGELRAAACGDHHTVCVTRAHRVFVFGEGSFGRLGLPSHVPLDPMDDGPYVGKQVMTPQELGLFSTSGPKVTHVACGSAHTLALTAEGKVFAFGKNNTGQLGVGHFTDQYLPHLIQPSLFSQTGTKIRSIACGRSHSVFIDDTHTLYAAGESNRAQLGLGPLVSGSSVPGRVTAMDGWRVVRAACGEEFTVCLARRRPPAQTVVPIDQSHAQEEEDSDKRDASKGAGFDSWRHQVHLQLLRQGPANEKTLPFGSSPRYTHNASVHYQALRDRLTIDIDSIDSADTHHKWTPDKGTPDEKGKTLIVSRPFSAGTDVSTKTGKTSPASADVPAAPLTARGGVTHIALDTTPRFADTRRPVSANAHPLLFHHADRAECHVSGGRVQSPAHTFPPPRLRTPAGKTGALGPGRYNLDTALLLTTPRPQQPVPFTKLAARQSVVSAGVGPGVYNVARARDRLEGERGCHSVPATPRDTHQDYFLHPRRFPTTPGPGEYKMTHSVLYTRAPSLSFDRATRAQPPRPETSSGPSPPALTSSFAEHATGAVTFANTPRFRDLEKRGRSVPHRRRRSSKRFDSLCQARLQLWKDKRAQTTAKSVGLLKKVRYERARSRLSMLEREKQMGREQREEARRARLQQYRQKQMEEKALGERRDRQLVWTAIFFHLMAMARFRSLSVPSAPPPVSPRDEQETLHPLTAVGLLVHFLRGCAAAGKVSRAVKRYLLCLRKIQRSWRVRVASLRVWRRIHMKQWKTFVAAARKELSSLLRRQQAGFIQKSYYSNLLKPYEQLFGQELLKTITVRRQRERSALFRLLREGSEFMMHYRATHFLWGTQTESATKSAALRRDERTHARLKAQSRAAVTCCFFIDSGLFWLFAQTLYKSLMTFVAAFIESAQQEGQRRKTILPPEGSSASLLPPKRHPTFMTDASADNRPICVGPYRIRPARLREVAHRAIVARLAELEAPPPPQIAEPAAAEQKPSPAPSPPARPSFVQPSLLTKLQRATRDLAKWGVPEHICKERETEGMLTKADMRSPVLVSSSSHSGSGGASCSDDGLSEGSDAEGGHGGESVLTAAQQLMFRLSAAVVVSSSAREA
ncbi:unnamed protein product [Vitrella brassicaformis CCMP3155]|uniref:RCC1-like domain-containing protein n=2 Tax=Vitrella brassicaformis TaxID=1169539 RepID=A0A0G4GUH5_VITBC|nr:unnamed protein product [Vitrella brassicaformis CCMP3155]|eukprot:CEM34211.1 unnamed protein product [Vitrella brassicaformis CCMP3155]